MCPASCINYIGASDKYSPQVIMVSLVNSVACIFMTLRTQLNSRVAVISYLRERFESVIIVSSSLRALCGRVKGLSYYATECLVSERYDKRHAIVSGILVSFVCA